MKYVQSGETINFPSIVAAGKYLESKDNKVSIPTIGRNLNTGEATNGYVFYETDSQYLLGCFTFNSERQTVNSLIPITEEVMANLARYY